MAEGKKRGRPKGVKNKASKNERNQEELAVIAKERMPAVASSSKYKYKSDKFTCPNCKREVSVHFDLKTEDGGKIRKLHEC